MRFWCLGRVILWLLVSNCNMTGTTTPVGSVTAQGQQNGTQLGSPRESAGGVETESMSDM
jgi:hypothetical protein